MNRHLVATVGILLAAAIGAASGCGSDAGTPADDTAAVLSETIPGPADHYYRVRPDPRWCVVARCSGFFLIPLEKGIPGVRVGALDFADVGDDEHLMKAV